MPTTNQMVEDPDDALYSALVELNDEWAENSKRIKALAQSGQMDHATLVLEVTETLLPLMTELSARLCEALAPEDDEDGDEEDDEEGEDEELGSALIAEDAELLAKLLVEYRDSVQLIRNAETETKPILALDDKLSEIGGALRLITDITLSDDEEPRPIGQA